MNVALIRKAVLGHTFSTGDRIAVIEKSTEAIVWREISETAEELGKFDCVIVSDRGLGGVILEKQIEVVFQMNLTGLWIATPNGLHQTGDTVITGKFIPWPTAINELYYGKIGVVFFGLMFQLWDGTVNRTKIEDLVSKAAQN